MKFITVFISISINDVNYIKAFLEASGIQAHIWDETIGMLVPHYTWGQGGPRVVVSNDQAQEALEIVSDYKKTRRE